MDGNCVLLVMQMLSYHAIACYYIGQGVRNLQWSATLCLIKRLLGSYNCRIISLVAFVLVLHFGYMKLQGNNSVCMRI